LTLDARPHTAGDSADATPKGGAPAESPEVGSVPAIVFGTSITALGVVRTLGRRGIPVFVHTNPGDLVTRSRFYHCLPVPAEFRGGAASANHFLQILRALPFDRAVVFPCTDIWTEAAASIPPSLQKRFITSDTPRESIATLLDKARLARVMSELGLPHPRTIVSDNEDDLYQIDESGFRGAFLKPRSSARFIDRYKVKALHAATKQEAIGKFHELKNAGFDVVLQEYVPGPPTAHYFIDGFIDRAGNFRTTFARRRMRMYPADFGNSTYMKSVPLETVRPALDALEILLKHLNYHGIFSAEFKKDPRNEQFNLLEVNVRPWWYVEFAESCGAPIIEMAYADALGLPLPRAENYKVGVGCAYPYFDLEGYFWYRRARKTGNAAALATTPTSFLSHVWSWITSRQPIFAMDDPAPVLSNFSFLCRRFLKNHLLPHAK
jgi:predicted ATP-grasp superfamily ATP-dependent carboligase